MGACSSAGESSPMLSVSINHRVSSSKLNLRASKSAVDLDVKTTISLKPREHRGRSSATTLRLDDSYSPLELRTRQMPLQPQISPTTILMTPCRPSSRRGIKTQRPREGLRFYVEDDTGVRCSNTSANPSAPSRSMFSHPQSNPRTILSMLRASREEEERNSIDCRDSSTYGMDTSIHSAGRTSFSSRTNQLLRSTSIVSTTDNSLGSVLSIVGLEKFDSPETKKALQRDLPYLTALSDSH